MGKQMDQKRMDDGTNLFRSFIMRKSQNATLLDPSDSPTGVPELSSDFGVDSIEYARDDGSLLSLQPWIFKKENNRDSTHSVSICRRPERNQSPLRTRRRSGRHSIKPLASVNNCLIPSLYSEQFEMEDWDSPSMVRNWRPVLVTDGGNIFSGSSSYYDGSQVLLGNGLCNETNATENLSGSIIGGPSLPRCRGSKWKRKELGPKTPNKPDVLDSQSLDKPLRKEDSADEKLIVCIGIIIGIISSMLINRREAEQLNDLLKHNETSVQDLQEELHSKDSLRERELEDDKVESQGQSNSYPESGEHAVSFQNPVSTPHIPLSIVDDFDKSCFSKDVYESESMSKIEAELEAELEILEFNMNSASLDERMSTTGTEQLSPDLVAEVVRGDLRADMFDSGAHYLHNDRSSNGESSDSSRVNMSHAVPAIELSLRLHEVIKLRMEKRIKELEDELYQSQKQIQLMENKFQRDCSSSDFGSSSNLESPTILGQDKSSMQPFCMNLSGDASSEACDDDEEITKVPDVKSKASSDLPTCEKVLRDREFSDTDDTDEKESEKLIKQIVEKTRQGSPLLTQWMMFLMKE